jgi:5-methylcytosine-specific restriction enzyme A
MIPIDAGEEVPDVVPYSIARTISEGRSTRWPRVRAKHLAAHPACVCCGGRKLLNVHHVRPFHVAPELELDPGNLITLCEGARGLNCHLWVGHCGHWKAWNVGVLRDAITFGGILQSRAGLAWHDRGQA